MMKLPTELFGDSCKEAYDRVMKELDTEVINENGVVSLVGYDYVLLPSASTYGLGVQALREACEKEKNSAHPAVMIDGSGLVRPLTFRENIECRVNDYETLKDGNGKERKMEGRLRLFSKWLDSCTGVAYKAGSSNFKLNPLCRELITINKGFNGAFLDVNYNAFKGVELDSSKGKYNQYLTKDEVLNHDGWNEAVEGDKKLLEAYASIIFKQKKDDKMMRFYTRSNTKKDELRALFVNYLDGNSNANSGSDLSNGGSFLLVAQKIAP